jgi:hypothetical protein
MKQTKMASAPPLPLALLFRGFGFPDRLSTENKAVLIRSDQEYSIISSERRLIRRHENASKKIFLATRILVSGFVLFIGGRWHILCLAYKTDFGLD